MTHAEAARAFFGCGLHTMKPHAFCCRDSGDGDGTVGCARLSALLASTAAEAVKGERERCAKVAHQHRSNPPERVTIGWDEACKAIAAAIRKEP